MTKEYVEKIKVTNNEFQKIQGEQADIYWKKVFAIDSNIDELESKKLKALYLNEFNEYLNKYEVIPFKHEDENVTEILNAYFNLDFSKGDYLSYQGNLSSDYSLWNKIMIKLNLKEMINTEYYKVAYNSDTQIIFEYCEGSISIQTTGNKGTFNRLLEKTFNFIKKNY